MILTILSGEYESLMEQWVRYVHALFPRSLSEVFPSLREGQAFALIYSVASRSTFERIESFRQIVLRVKRYKPYFVLVGNKIDKYMEREVSVQEGKDLAEKFGCEYIEASAKTGISVQKMFFDLVRILRGARPMMCVNGPPIQVVGRNDKRGCVLM